MSHARGNAPWLPTKAALIGRRRGDCARECIFPLCISGKLHMLDPVLGTSVRKFVIMAGKYTRISIPGWWRT